MAQAAVVENIDQPESPLSEFWGYFKQNKGAVLGLALIIAFTLMAIFAPLISPYDPTIVHEGDMRLAPAWDAAGMSKYIFGTDDVGRDILSRLIYGARISMSIGLAVVFLSLVMGIVLGLFSGFYGGWVDRLIMRCIDILMALPSILLAIVVVSIMGPGIKNAVLAVAIVEVPAFTRIIRSSVLAEKNKQYVLASRTFGASDLRIMFFEILPNCLAPLIVQASLGFSNGILNAAALGFLGLGAQPPLPEWGTMLSDARPYIESSPWMVTLPGICVSVSVLGFNLFGDGLRDALDPRLKK